MNKEELLQELSAKAPTPEGSTRAPTNFSVTKMLYALGAAIVVIGIILFVSQLWDDIGSFGRILVTLGLGLLFAFIGSTLLKNKPEDNIGSVFHAIGGLMIPGGAMVALSEMNVESTTLWPVTITFGTIFAFYLLLNIIHKNVVLTFFAIANGTAFIYFLAESALDADDDFYAYLTMAVGLGYLLLGHSFRGSWNRKLTSILYFFGISGFLGGAFSQVFDSVFWQMLYVLLIVGSFYLAVYLKSRSILVMSSVFLIAHVTYITSEYFADSIGWPITLVLLGFVFIGLGYASITINKKFITE